MDIFQKIKKARKELGLTQADMAKSIQLSQNAISKLESGQKKFVPNEYITFLHEKGYDINSIFDNKAPLRKLDDFMSGASSESTSKKAGDTILKNKMIRFLGLPDEMSLHTFLNNLEDTEDQLQHPLERWLLLAWEKKYLSKFESLIQRMEIYEEDILERAPGQLDAIEKKGKSQVG